MRPKDPETPSSSPAPQAKEGSFPTPTSKPEFKNASGTWLLKTLFFETSTEPDKVRAIYTFKPEDHTYNGRTYKSLRRLYLEEGDDTEYYFAEKYFGGWPHFKRLLSCTWFVDYLSEIREELAARQTADAKRRIREIAKNKNDRGSLQANRVLLEETKKSQNPVGRPTKESIRRKAEELFQDQSELQDDLERITQSIGGFSS